MGHVCADEVTSGEGTDKGQLASHDGSCDDTSKLLSILSGHRWVCTPDAEHVKDRALGPQDSTSTDGADFNAGHGHSHEQVFAAIRSVKNCISPLIMSLSQEVLTVP